MLDQTNEKNLRSWIKSANEEMCNFPIQNLPYGLFNVAGQSRRLGVAIGDQVLDLGGADGWSGSSHILAAQQLAHLWDVTALARNPV